MLIGQFAKARLLVCDDPDKKEAVVEVAHEALLTHWPRLKSWIEERFGDFRLRWQLQHAAAEWKAKDCKDAYLWSDERVIEARGMLERIRYQPTEIEQRFLGPIDPTRMLEELDDPATPPGTARPHRRSPGPDRRSATRCGTQGRWLAGHCLV